MSADLHLHTTASDGSFKPSIIVKCALDEGLNTIAITDHDTFAGIEEANKTASNLPIEVIPGVELSAAFHEKDIHFIAYWPEYKEQWLIAELECIRKSRIKRANSIIKKLKENNINISFEEVKKITGNATLGRSHIARVLLKRGYVRNIQEAFDKYIGNEAPFFVGKNSRSPEELLALIKKAHGVAVLAHPGLAGIDHKIDDLKDKGLDGIEVYHPDHNAKQTQKYKEIAKKSNLIATAGSDFHATKSHRGTKIGAFRVGNDVVEQLRAKKISI